MCFESREVQARLDRVGCNAWPLGCERMTMWLLEGKPKTTPSVSLRTHHPGGVTMEMRDVMKDLRGDDRMGVAARTLYRGVGRPDFVGILLPRLVQRA